MVFGMAGAGGTLSGGWASDRFGPLRTLRVQLALLLGMMLVVPLTRGHYALMMLVFVVWGVAGFGMMSPTQARQATVSPTQAPILVQHERLHVVLWYGPGRRGWRGGQRCFRIRQTGVDRRCLRTAGSRQFCKRQA